MKFDESLRITRGKVDLSARRGVRNRCIHETFVGKAHGGNMFQFTKICKDFEMTIAFSETKFLYRPSCRYVYIPNWHL
jgi:hypothetical protein